MEPMRLRGSSSASLPPAQSSQRPNKRARRNEFTASTSSAAAAVNGGFYSDSEEEDRQADSRINSRITTRSMSAVSNPASPNSQRINLRETPSEPQTENEIEPRATNRFSQRQRTSSTSHDEIGAAGMSDVNATNSTAGPSRQIASRDGNLDESNSNSNLVDSQGFADDSLSEPSTEEELAIIPPSAVIPRMRVHVSVAPPAVVDLTESGSEEDFNENLNQTKGKQKQITAENSLVLLEPVALIPTTSTPASPPLPAAPAVSLANLTCPICLGAPTPLAVTSCGHCFCAPCLHAALVAGPPLTPPAVDYGLAARGRGRGRAVTNAPNLLFRVNRGTGNQPNNNAAGYFGANQPDTELDKHCPVCRNPLRGGWGKSLRGLVLRMEPVKKRENEKSAEPKLEI